MIAEIFLACALAVPSMTTVHPIAEEQTSFLSSLLNTTYGNNWREDRERSRVLFYGNVPMWISSARRSFDRIYAMAPIQKGAIDIVGLPTGIPISAGAINVLVYLSSIPIDKWATMKYASEINRVLRDRGVIVFYERVAPSLKLTLSHLGYTELKAEAKYLNFTVMRKNKRLFAKKIDEAA